MSVLAIGREVAKLAIRQGSSKVGAYDPADAERFGHRKLAIAHEALTQCLALDIRTGTIDERVIRTELEQRLNAGVLASLRHLHYTRLILDSAPIGGPRSERMTLFSRENP